MSRDEHIQHGIVFDDALAIFLDEAQAIGHQLDDQRLADAIADICPCFVRGEGRENHHIASLGRNTDGGVLNLGLIGAAQPDSIGGAIVDQGAQTMDAGQNPRAAIIAGGIIQRDPAGDIGLGIGEGITIILMPREDAGFFRLFINRLIPIKPQIGADEIMADGGKERACDQIAHRFGMDDQIAGKADGIGFIAKTAPALQIKGGIADPGFDGIDVGHQALEPFRAKGFRQLDIARFIELLHLIGAQIGETIGGAVGKDEIAIAGVGHEWGHGKAFCFH